MDRLHACGDDDTRLRKGSESGQSVKASAEADVPPP